MHSASFYSEPDDVSCNTMLKIRELFILIICGKIGAVRTSAHLKTFLNLHAFVDGEARKKVAHCV